MSTSVLDLVAALNAPKGASDFARISLLRTYVSSDPEREAALDGVAELARSLTGAPMAFVSIVETDHQWFLGAAGSHLRRLPINSSICAFSLGSQELLEIPDTVADERSTGMDLVVNYGVRFYAGAPLRTPEGVGLGALCVMDTRTRVLSDAQRFGLAELAGQVMAQLELRRSLKQCERALFAHRQIMAVAGHDLGDPLMRAEVVLYGLQRRSTWSDEDLREIVLAREAVNEASTTLRRLAHASLLDRQQVVVATVSLLGIFATLEDRWRQRLAETGRTLVLRPIDAEITSNSVLILNILENLISNALEHASDGTITVEAGRGLHGVWIAVADEGQNFPADECTRIVDALVRAEANGAGLGLGLAIVQRTAELLGARVSVQSQSGQGARFTVEFPKQHPTIASGLN